MFHIVNTFFFYFNVLNKKHSIQLQINSIQKPINLDLLLAGDNYISYAENAVLINFVHAYISNIKRQRKSNHVNPMLNLYVINAWLFFSTYLLTIEIFYTSLFSFSCLSFTTCVYNHIKQYYTILHSLIR